MVVDDATIEALSKWTGETRIKYVPNAKTGNTKSAERYASYSQARSVDEALRLGTTPGDILHDFQRKFLVMVRLRPDRQQPRCAEEQNALSDRFFSIFTPSVAAQLRAKQGKVNKALALSEALGVDLRAAQQLKEGNETAEVTAGRLLADRAAQVVLEAVEQEERRVTDKEVLAVLRLWAFKKNDSRQNVLPEGQKWVFSDTFGLVRSRTGTLLVTSATQEYPHLTMMLNKWLHDRRPAEMEEDFPCTSISLNSGYAARRHRDGNNEGPSLIRGFGDYRGGQLAYWPDDDRSGPVEDLCHDDRVPLDISKGLVLFDGVRGHEVDSFEGERFSVVWFCLGKFWQASTEERKFLGDVGFHVPEGKALGPVSKLLPPPRGYSGCQSLATMFGRKEEKAKVWQWPEVRNFEEDRAAAKVLSKFQQDGGNGAPQKNLSSFWGKASAGQGASISTRAPESPPPSQRLQDTSDDACQQLSGEKPKRGRPRKADGTLMPEGSPPAKKQLTALIASAKGANGGTSKEKASRAGLSSGQLETFAGFVKAIEAARARDDESVSEPLTEYFQSMLLQMEDPEKHLCAAFDLLASTAALPQSMLTSAVTQAFGRGAALVQDSDLVAKVRAARRSCSSAPRAPPLKLCDVADARRSALDDSGSLVQGIANLLAATPQEGEEVAVLVDLLQGRPGLPRPIALRALAHAFALARPGSSELGAAAAAQRRRFRDGEERQEALDAMEKAVSLTFGELGGLCVELAEALLEGCKASELHARCPPCFGTAVLSMEATVTADLGAALAMVAGPTKFVEQCYVGERVQIHKLNGCLNIFGADRQDMGKTFEESARAAVRAALTAKGCILDAVLLRDGSLMAFDCIWLNGRPLTRRAFRCRREALRSCVQPSDVLRMAASSEEFTAHNPLTNEVAAALLDEAVAQGCSGLVLKDADSEYEAGMTTAAWCAVQPSMRSS